MTIKDCYEMGRYVARHSPGGSGRRLITSDEYSHNVGVTDRKLLAGRLDGIQFTSYMLGRDRNWRMGEY